MKKTENDKIDLLSQDHKIQLMVSQSDHDEDEIDLGQLIRKVMSGRTMIYLCTLVAILIAGLGFIGYNIVLQKDQGNVSTVISFNFKGIEEGLSPDGETSFNISELTNKQVLENTISQLGLGVKSIDSETLRRNIEIQGIVPADVMRRITLINKMAEKDVTQLEKISDMTYYPTQYKINLKITKDMELDQQESEQVLLAIVNNYKEYFMVKYNDREILSTAINTVELGRYDYSEYIMLVNSQLGIAKTYLETKQEEAPGFRSKTTGVSFEDLLGQVDLIQNVEINNVQAVINTFVVTKNKERVFSIYENKIKSLTREMKEHTQRASSFRQAAVEYKKDGMLILGSEGIDNALEVTKSSKAYDNFIIDAVEAEKAANLLKYDIDHYTDLFTKISTTDEENANVNIAPYVVKVEEDIAYIAEKVKALVENINTTVDEYYTVEVFKSSVKMDVPTMYSSGFMALIKKGVMTVAIATVLGMMLGVVLALSKGILSEEGSESK